MGEAKRRGTFAERKQEAILKKQNWFQKLVNRIKRRLLK